MYMCCEFVLERRKCVRNRQGRHYIYYNGVCKGRIIRKVMWGWGGGKAKIKIEQGKQKEKKIRARKKFKKKFVQRLFNRENYKLCKGGPQIWKIKRFLI